MAIGNEELMQKCSPEHFSIETTRMKKYKETEEEGKKRRVSMGSTAGTKKISLDGSTVARALYRPEAVYELPNEPNLHI